mgnify:CR=1 FL=1
MAVATICTSSFPLQAVLPLLTSDLYNVMMSCCTGSLSNVKVEFDLNKSALALVLVSGGYPEKYKKMLQIRGKLLRLSARLLIPTRSQSHQIRIEARNSESNTNSV